MVVWGWIVWNFKSGKEFIFKFLFFISVSYLLKDCFDDWFLSNAYAIRLNFCSSFDDDLSELFIDDSCDDWNGDERMFFSRISLAFFALVAWLRFIWEILVVDTLFENELGP